MNFGAMSLVGQTGTSAGPQAESAVPPDTDIPNPTLCE